jgi:glycosyltransferase involved in cell wall biosynthesis
VPAGAPLLVVDAESSDATVAIARERGAEVVVFPWRGFVAARRAALGRVTTPWTFMLDADEALDAELAAAVRAAEPGPDADGFAVRRATYLCGRPMRYGTWGRDAPLRLFRSDRATLVAAPVAGGAAELHERWVVPGRVAPLAGALHHDSYPTLAAYRAKFARYTEIEARGVRGTLVRLLRAAALAAPRAFWALVVRQGWRDGWRGAFVAAASAWYPVAVAWKALRAR